MHPFWVSFSICPEILMMVSLMKEFHLLYIMRQGSIFQNYIDQLQWTSWRNFIQYWTGMRFLAKINSQNFLLYYYLLATVYLKRTISVLVEILYTGGIAKTIWLCMHIEGFHVTSLQQNLPSHAAHSGHVGSHKILPDSLLLKLHKA